MTINFTFLVSEYSESEYIALNMAGDEGFEPPVPPPEGGALPLGQSPAFTHQKGRA